MPISLSPQMMRQIIMDHYDNPQFKHAPKDNKQYEKINMNSASCIDNIDVYVEVEDGKVKDLRMAFGSVNITCARDRKIEEKYIGLTVEELHNQIENIQKDYSSIVQPITDQRSTKAYRSKVAMNILRDFINVIE